MYIVEKYLLEILVQYRQVTLPGIGTLSNHIEESSADYVSGQFTPPKAEVLFDGKTLDSSDLLLNYIQKAEGSSIDQAQALLNRFIEKINHGLDDGNVVRLYGIGELSMNSGGEVTFSADPEGYIPEQFYGLPIIRFFPQGKPIESPVGYQRPVSITEEPIPAPLVIAEKKSFPVKTLAGILGVIVIGVVAYFIIDNWKKKQAESNETLTEIPADANLNVSPDDSLVADTPNTSAPEEYVPAEPTPANPTQKAEELPPVVAKEPVAPEKVETPQANNSARERSTIHKGECLVMVGAFKSQENARRMLRKVKSNGFQAFYKQKGNFTIVGVISDCDQVNTTLSDARTQLDTAAYILRQGSVH